MTVALELTAVSKPSKKADWPMSAAPDLLEVAISRRKLNALLG